MARVRRRWVRFAFVLAAAGLPTGLLGTGCGRTHEGSESGGDAGSAGSAAPEQRCQALSDLGESCATIPCRLGLSCVDDACQDFRRDALVDLPGRSAFSLTRYRRTGRIRSESS